jgi:hypothetical protein
VLVVRGALRGSGAAPAPDVRLELRDASGRPLAAPTFAAPVRLAGADLSPAALSRGLEAGFGAARHRSIRTPSGFTLLVPDPPAEARSFRVRLIER